MRNLFIFLLLFVFVLSFSSGQNAFGPELNKALEKDRGGEYRVIVLMKEQFDVKTLNRGNKAQLISQLQAKCQNSQRWVRSFIQNTQRSHEIKDVHHFWIVNAITLKTKADVLRQLALQSDIKGIYLDREQVMVRPIKADATRAAWGVTYIKADQVQKGGNNGKGVIVAVCDTGIDLDHKGFAPGQILVSKGKSFISGEPTADDGHGHGTHCAGTIGSPAYGVAPGVSIVPVKVLSK